MNDAFPKPVPYHYLNLRSLQNIWFTKIKDIMFNRYKHPKDPIDNKTIRSAYCLKDHNKYIKYACTAGSRIPIIP